jgi:hypothetical protein
MAENSLNDLIKYLDVTTAQFRHFWDSLTEAEKAEFKATELPKS